MPQTTPPPQFCWIVEFSQFWTHGAFRHFFGNKMIAVACFKTWKKTRAQLYSSLQVLGNFCVEFAFAGLRLVSHCWLHSPIWKIQVKKSSPLTKKFWGLAWHTALRDCMLRKAKIGKVPMFRFCYSTPSIPGIRERCHNAKVEQKGRKEASQEGRTWRCAELRDWCSVFWGGCVPKMLLEEND